MSGKTNTSSGKRRAAASKSTKSKSTAKTTKKKIASGGSGNAASTTRAASGAKSTASKKKSVSKKTTAKKSVASSASSGSKDVSKPAANEQASLDVLARAEAEIKSAVESMNTQMSSAMETLMDLTAARQGRGKAVVRTAALDRATAMFQRLVADVLDDQLSEVLPTLVALRSETAHRQQMASDDAGDGDDFYERATAMLDQALAGANVVRYEVQSGDVFDPLIHLAVGEERREDMENGAVVMAFQPGFRTAQGKVISQAKVKVNRR